ncbi:NAD(P)/FAD-dependent oxidoreductase [Lachnoclostridium phytofermentans]|uniref:Thioredoxin-disulfide reductase n=1 Tax=Lachnoclostridium phytofermentans (strain ATCC 700394 / DSM 18823 / ISDg) TaxID=357809 RepID=A9KPX8_LACP7|nr:NAD(P)/FAD-dependent oxidoreductase [Lachnoclostridium phytofermentans]ABX41877.1 Thioredoxin-disulfide reductase [Lachnoclostridium phytofermentans ISDg]
MANVIIIGNGPAGISTALYTIRAGIETTIIGKDFGALGKASEIENYYGFSQPISGEDLVKEGIEGAKRLGVNFISDEVLGLSYIDQLVVNTKNEDYTAKSVVIATGTARNTPKIKGLKDLEGHGVSYCAVCDAFFYRGKDVAVLGDGEYALHEALELLQTSNSVTLLTNGKTPAIEIPDFIKVNTTPIESLEGQEALETIIFEDGSKLSISGLFVAVGVAGSTDLAKKIGAITENNKIVVDNNMATNIPGLYAAGDCTGGMLQISKAVYDGAKAGTSIVKYLRNPKSKTPQI